MALECFLVAGLLFGPQKVFFVLSRKSGPSSFRKAWKHGPDYWVFFFGFLPALLTTLGGETPGFSQCMCITRAPKKIHNTAVAIDFAPRVLSGGKSASACGLRGDGRMDDENTNERNVENEENAGWPVVALYIKALKFWGNEFKWV